MPYGLTLKPEDPLYNLILDIPDISFNPVGTKSRRALVNKLREKLPGSCKEPYLLKPKVFKKIFYPHYADVDYQNKVASVTALPDDFWTGFSISVLCQSIYSQTLEAKNSLDIDKINSDVSHSNKSIQSKALIWYAYVLFQDFMHFTGDTTSAKKTYTEQINSTTWVNYKMKSYADGSWDNPDWELYHHFAKLTALGATVDDVNTLIGSLLQKGLRISPSVSADNWTSYLVWCQPSNLTHKDVDKDAEAGELKTASISNPYGVSTLSEAFSFDFISAGQPGNKYCKSTIMSCLSSDTQVLMANNSLKAIQEIKVGESLMTPQGERKVMLVSTPKRRKRCLYGVNGLSFKFTATHPFVSATITPKLLSILPLDLLSNVPLIGQNGIGLLQKGSEVMGYDLRYNKGYSVEVTSVEKVPVASKKDELVIMYDLILEPDPSGKFEYIVGSKESLFVVASVNSTTDNYTSSESMAFDIVIGMVTRAAHQLEALYNSTDEVKYSSLLCSLSRDLVAFLPTSAIYVRYENQSAKIPESLPLNKRIASASKLFLNKDGIYNDALGMAYNYLMYRVFSQLSSILSLGYRVISEKVKVDSLAIGIFDFQVKSSSPRIPPDPTVTVSASSVTVKMETRADKVLQFGKKIYRTAFIPVAKMKADDDSPITIVLSDPENDKVLLTATLRLEDFQSQVSVYRHLSLYDQAKVEQGYMNVDVRLVPEDQEETEEKEAKKYDTKKQSLLSSHLLKDGGTYLTSLCEAYTAKKEKDDTKDEKKDDKDKKKDEKDAKDTTDKDKSKEDKDKKKKEDDKDKDDKEKKEDKDKAKKEPEDKDKKEKDGEDEDKKGKKDDGDKGDTDSQK